MGGPVVKKEPHPKHLEPPDYHGNPIDEKGSLVITEWGPELIDFIYEHSGMTTTIYNIHNLEMGLEAEFLEVFVSTKRAGVISADEEGPKNFDLLHH